MLAWLCGIVLSSAVLLGGGTHAGFLGDVFVQLLSLPLLAAALWIAFEQQGRGRQKYRILIFGCTTAVLVGIELIPLPFDVWTGGSLATAPASSLDLPRTWAPLSMTPQATWAAAASLIVPAAIFLAAMQLNLRQRLALIWVLLALGALALLLGFLQVAQGPESALRLYDITNPSEAVGFFANRNHFAAHLYVTLVLGAVWFSRTANQALNPGALKTRSILWATTAAVFLVSVVSGLAMARSRAGVFLAMAALAGIVLLILKQRQNEPGTARRRFTAGRISVMTVLFAALFTAQFGLGSILSRFQGDHLEDLRVTLARTTFETALESLPLGTGLGSFVPVYAVAEKSKDVFADYVNRAHNDFAEFFLETGVVGVLLFLTFLVWFCRRTYSVWLRPEAGEHSSQLLIQRAAALIVFLLLAHSSVDYPLRTTALSAVFAFFCAVLATEGFAAGSEQIRPRQKFSKQEQPLVHAGPGEKWGSDLHWPESWQKRAG